jgi:hypothetical protein
MFDSALDRIFDEADSLSAEDLRGPIRDELKRRDAAWARLVRAIDTLGAALPEDEPKRDETRREYFAALQSLRDLGVDVDTLLEER